MTLPIFLAEDDAVLRTELTALIDAVCDAQVVATAETQAAASAWLRDHPRDWQFGVLDLELKEGTGFGVLESLADPAMRARIIVLTNAATPENRTRCLQLGASAVYDKTAELEQFLSHCERWSRMTPEPSDAPNTRTPIPRRMPPRDAQEREDKIRVAAYAAAEQRGFAPGLEEEDWLAAELAVDAAQARAMTPSPRCSTGGDGIRRCEAEGAEPGDGLHRHAR